MTQQVGQEGLRVFRTRVSLITVGRFIEEEEEECAHGNWDSRCIIFQLHGLSLALLSLTRAWKKVHVHTQQNPQKRMHLPQRTRKGSLAGP